jgi:ABC-type amino acid transport substrate-binding protein
MLLEGDRMRSLILKFFPALIATSLVLIACSAPVVNAAPVASTTPTAIMAGSKPPTSPESDEVWDRILKNKKIVVGSSWDYPPFGSVNSDFQVVGFDIALIEEIGRRLQIPIDIQNYAFEGLTDALQLNQIDLAVAAISVTPERTQQMTFSPVYYIDEAAVLARNDSQVPEITNFDNLAGFRVGVARGTTYEKMVQHYLVDAGKMPADKMFRYAQSDDAVRDLIVRRVDVVLLGQATANYYGSREDLKVAAVGFQKQELAVAMRLGTPRLNAEIARVINEMLKDGTIQRLDQEYLKGKTAGMLSTLIPGYVSPSTPLPPIPTTTPAKCVNGMKYVADVTIPDNNMQNPTFINPGTGFAKVWRLQNTGTCTWTPNYHLAYAYGNVSAAQMNGQSVPIPFNVAPGQNVDVSVNLVAPNEHSTYQGFWQMESDAGNRFGRTIWVGITTRVNQPAPVATNLPSGNSCTVSIESPADSININNAFDTVWIVKNASGQDWVSDSVDYKYISGTAMHEKAAYDLPQTVKNGESVKIIVDMIAPDKPGNYSTNWAIVAGGKTFCSLGITVSVIQ